MENPQFNQLLQSEGYTHIKFIEGLGYCGLKRFIFTTGLCYGLNETGFEGRWCYEKLSDAKEALKTLTTVGPDDEHWIKYKGIMGEWSNPKQEKS